MNRIAKIFLGLLVLYVLFTILKGFVPKNIDGVAHFINGNELIVQVDDGLDIEKVKLEISIWGTTHEDVSVFENNRGNAIPKGYGENDWYLTYNEESFGVFRHFKTNNWHDHEYALFFYEKDGIKCDIKISGPDAMSRTVELDKHTKTELGSENRIRIKQEN